VKIGRLHVITDETIQKRFSHLELAALAARGGADVVQYREKRTMDGEVCSRLLIRIARAVESCDATLIVDDRVHAARSAGVKGVHLGRDDLPVSEARRILGPDAVIGGTAHSVEEALEAAATSLNYLGVGSVWPTSSRQVAAPVIGLDGLAEIVEAVSLPVIAIGGIDACNVKQVMATGVHGVAVLSAVVCQPDPEAATRELAGILDV
jgi:thiamine-phosphate pyrophosphorylase